MKSSINSAAECCAFQRRGLHWPVGCVCRQRHFIGEHAALLLRHTLKWRRRKAGNGVSQGHGHGWRRAQCSVECGVTHRAVATQEPVQQILGVVAGQSCLILLHPQEAQPETDTHARACERIAVASCRASRERLEKKHARAAQPHLSLFRAATASTLKLVAVCVFPSSASGAACVSMGAWPCSSCRRSCCSSRAC